MEWIRPDPVLARRVRSFYGASGALCLAMAAAVVSAALILGGAKQVLLSLSVGSFLLGCSWWARSYSAAIPERMILEEDRLRVVWPDGRSELLSLDDAVHDGHGLLAGSRWVPFYAKFRGRPREPLYRLDEMEALKARAVEIGVVGFFLEGLRRKEPLSLAHALIWLGGFAAIVARIFLASS